MRWPHHRYALKLLAVYLLAFVVLALAPVDRLTWLLENALGLAVVAALWLSRNRLPLSRVSYSLIFIHLMLHTLGAHYTYSSVPYDAWSQSIFGSSISQWFGWQRNHYDRLIHFFYGLLIAYPIREFCVRVVDVRGFWSYFLPLDVTMSTSMLYEVLEWAVAEKLGDGALDYVGTQGDPWDAQKDMALATLGAIITMGVTAAINARLRRDFAKEFAASLRVKHIEPLGEDELAKLMEDKRP